jgi:predicted N-formylglutamate amidohydrolase
MEKNHYLKSRKKSYILLTAEHASPRIPSGYRNLGLSRSERQGAKDLYDPGSLAVLRILEKKLDASYLYANISRLVIDCNRILDGKNRGKNTFHSGALKKQLLTDCGDGEKTITIPGNSFADEKKFLQEEKIRYGKYADPYKEAGCLLTDKILKIHQKALIVMIHSFFPVYNGEKRKVDIGVLYDKSKKIGLKVVRSLRKNTTLNIGDNRPWKMSDADGGIFGHLQGKDEVGLLAFDINNKHLKSKKDIEKIAKLIYQALNGL